MVFHSSDSLSDPCQCESIIQSETLGPIQVGAVISRGAFSLVMAGTAIQSSMQVAIKVGIAASAGMGMDAQILRAFNGSDSFPYFYGDGTTVCVKKISKRTVTYPYIVMERLGAPVSSLQNMYLERSARLAAALDVAEQMLDGVERVHGMRYLLHDVYAENVLIKMFSQRLNGVSVKLVDFGEIVPFDQSAKYNHVNSLYSSVREDAGEPLSPRDDLERIVYVIMTIVDTHMPWGDVLREERRVKKLRFDLSSQGKFYPPQVSTLLNYARKELRFAQPIDFEYCRGLLKAAAKAVV